MQVIFPEASSNLFCPAEADPRDGITHTLLPSGFQLVLATRVGWALASDQNQLSSSLPVS